MKKTQPWGGYSPREVTLTLCPTTLWLGVSPNVFWRDVRNWPGPPLEADTQETNQIFLAHCNLITLSSLYCQITTTPIATFPSQEQAQLRQLCSWWHKGYNWKTETPTPPPHTHRSSVLHWLCGRDPEGVPVLKEGTVVQDPKTAFWGISKEPRVFSRDDRGRGSHLLECEGRRCTIMSTIPQISRWQN